MSFVFVCAALAFEVRQVTKVPEGAEADIYKKKGGCLASVLSLGRLPLQVTSNIVNQFEIVHGLEHERMQHLHTRL